MSESLTRRKALTIVAAVPAAIAVAAAVTAVPALAVPAVTMAKGSRGKLAMLVKRYFSEIDAFNTFALTDDRTDEEADACAEATFEATREQMIGVPARSAEDALAALDWVVKEVEIWQGNDLDDGSPQDQVVASLIDAIRGYIVSTSTI